MGMAVFHSARIIYSRSCLHSLRGKHLLGKRRWIFSRRWTILWISLTGKRNSNGFFPLPLSLISCLLWVKKGEKVDQSPQQKNLYYHLPGLSSFAHPNLLPTLGKIENMLSAGGGSILRMK